MVEPTLGCFNGTTQIACFMCTATKIKGVCSCSLLRWLPLPGQSSVSAAGYGKAATVNCRIWDQDAFSRNELLASGWS
jgi:hypothetical protein